MAARDYDRSHAELLARNRRRTPRAAAMADALFDLAREHGSQGLEDLAIQVDGGWVQRGVEISDDEWGRVFRAAVEVL